MMTTKRKRADQLTARLKQIIIEEYNDCEASRDAALAASVRLMLILHMKRCGVVQTIDSLRDLADIIEADLFRGPMQ